MFPNFKEFNENSESFSAYVKRLEQAFLLHDIKEEKKTPAFIALVGPYIYNLLTNLIFPDPPESKSYKEIIDVLCKHLNPVPNKITERIKFRKCSQLQTESIQEFSTRLKKMTTHCSFSGDTLNENLLEQFLRGLKSETIQSKLLTQVEDLNFEKAVEFAVNLQNAENDILEFQNRNAALNKISVVRKNKQVNVQNNVNKQNKMNKPPNFNVNKGKIKCYRCGDAHLANVCRFINTICNVCKKKGHLAKVCRSVGNTGSKQKHVNVLETVDILSLHTSPGNVKPIKIWVLIEKRAKAEMELDTGSAISAVPISRFKRLFPNHRIFPADIQLRTATGEIFQPVGYTNINVTYNDETKNVKLYLIKEDNFPLLLGRDWITEFNIFPNNLETVPVNKVTISENLKQLLSDYSDLFTNQVGEIKNVKAELHVEKDATPVFCKARTVTYALRNAVNEELLRLQNEGILKPVTTSKWATPIVPVVKPNGKIRLCGDFKVTVNKVLKVDKYPLPKIEDILATLGGGLHFTKIDLNQAYLHLPVDEKSQELLTINTPKGLFQFTRLPYGIASSPAIWQRTIEQILSGIDGVSVFIDDICISGETDDIHLQRLKQVLQRLREYNLKINKEKSFFMKNEITYCGYRIDKNGIHKTQEKVEAILNAPKPANVTQVKAFLGLVTYYSKFVPNLSTIAHPLNRLLQKNVTFKWTTDCERAFNAIKKEITSDRVLTHFNPKLPLVLATDASPYGISAVLSHTMPDNSEKPIAFVSRTLSKAEKRYSQVDKEALSIIFGVKNFFQFLYGRRFTLYTDSKPLVSIFSPNKSIPVLSAARMQRYALYLQTFKYDICYKKSVEHGNADALSRLPLRSEDLLPPPPDSQNSSQTAEIIDEAEFYQINQISTLPLGPKSLAIATRADPILSKIYSHLISGSEIPKELLFGSQQEEFTLQNNCILKGCRVAIPEVHRKQILQDIHYGHFGIVKMKALARSFVWWPKIDKDIEELVKNCPTCINLKNNPPKTNFHHWEWPTTPWQRIHIDFCGPVNGKMLLLVVDAHSKWPEVFIVPHTTSEYTINCLSSLFSRYGYPISLVSDNGPQFTSDEFQVFLRNHGIKHMLSAPYHPATNGQAEKFVQILKRGLKALASEPGTLQRKINDFLLQYRKMPHMTTGESPASLFLKRHIRTKIDLIRPNIAEHVQKKQNKNTFTHKIREFNIHEKVAVRNYTPEAKWKIGRIVAKEGKLHYKVKVGSNIWKRHIDQLTSVGSNIHITDETVEENEILHKTAGETMPSTTNINYPEINVRSCPTASAPEETNLSPPTIPDPAQTDFIHPDTSTSQQSDFNHPSDPDPGPNDFCTSVPDVHSPKISVSGQSNSKNNNSVSKSVKNNANVSFSQQVLRRSNRERKVPDRLKYS